MKKLLALGLWSLVLVSSAAAKSPFLSAFDSRYGTAGTKLDDCVTCHYPDYSRNPYGHDFELAKAAAGGDVMTGLANIEALDSDGDQASNLIEINARTFPGNPSDTPLPVTQKTWGAVKALYGS